MLVNNLIDQYLNTEDADLKYMTLRQDFKVENVEGLELLVRKVLLPILLHEYNSEIINLVSFQVFPNAVSKLVSTSETWNNDDERLWFDRTVVMPLIQDNVNSKRANLLKQTLRNILKSVFESELRNLSICNDETIIKNMLQQMEKSNDSHDEGTNYVIDWEILNLIVQLYYYTNLKMSKEVFVNILRSCPTHESLIEPIKNTLKNSFEVIDRKTLCDPEVFSLLGNSSVLEVVSHRWYQFSYIVIELLSKVILPRLNDDQDKQSEVLFELLNTLDNLQIFYSVPRMSTGTPFLNQPILLALETSIQKIITERELSAVEKNCETREESHELEDPIDEDPHQQAYIEELGGDDESFELEHDGDDQHVEDTLNNKILGLCYEILNNIKNWNLFTVSTGLDSRIPPETSVPKIQHTLTTSNNLSELQMAVELLDQNIYTTENLNLSEICTALLPHMKQNKSFFSTIKVGNMTQTIDEGLTLRMMVYSTLLQILTYEELPRILNYTVSCELLQETIHRGVRDPDNTINDLSLKILQRLLAENYNKILALDYEWYNEHVYEKAIISIKKAYKRVESLSLTTDTSNSMTILHDFETLFLRCYPAMN